MSATEQLLTALRRIVETEHGGPAASTAQRALDAYHHATRSLPVEGVIPCPRCKGAGSTEEGRCWPCGGAGAVPPGVVHIAAPPLYLGDAMLRQVCAWCGEKLVDAEADRIGLPIEPCPQCQGMKATVTGPCPTCAGSGTDDRPLVRRLPVWPTFELLLHDGAAWSTMADYPQDAPLPANFCGRAQLDAFHERNPS